MASTKKPVMKTKETKKDSVKPYSPMQFLAFVDTIYIKQIVSNFKGFINEKKMDNSNPKYIPGMEYVHFLFDADNSCVRVVVFDSYSVIVEYYPAEVDKTFSCFFTIKTLKAVILNAKHNQIVFVKKPETEGLSMSFKILFNYTDSININKIDPSLKLPEFLEDVIESLSDEKLKDYTEIGFNPDLLVKTINKMHNADDVSSSAVKMSVNNPRDKIVFSYKSKAPFCTNKRMLLPMKLPNNITKESNDPMFSGFPILGFNRSI